MTQVLRQRRYYVQGADWGSLVGTWLALDHPDNVAGLHLNHIYLCPPAFGGGRGTTAPDATEEEKAFLRDEAAPLAGAGLAYFWQPGGGPPAIADLCSGRQSFGCGRVVRDKFYAWSDRRSRPFEEVFTLDQMLDQIMLNRVTGTEDSFIWIYQGYIRENTFTLPEGVRVRPPVGVVATRDPLNLPPPRSLVERGYNVVHWTEAPEGGHFPMMERPDLYVADLRAFFRKVPLQAKRRS